MKHTTKFADMTADERLIEMGRMFAYLREDDTTAGVTRRLVELLSIDYMERLTAEANRASKVGLGVTRTITVDAVDTAKKKAIEDNPGWRLLHVGLGTSGQTNLTYGWGDGDDRG